MFCDNSGEEEGAPATVHSRLLASGGIGRDLTNTYVPVLCMLTSCCHHPPDHYIKLRPPAMFYDLELPYDSRAETFKLQTPFSSEWNFPKCARWGRRALLSSLMNMDGPLRHDPLHSNYT